MSAELNPQHWSELSERGARLGLKAVVSIYRLLGRRASLWLVSLIAVFYVVFDGERRRFSVAYLARVAAQNGAPAPGWRDAFRHFRNFAEKSLDAYVGWIAPETFADVPIKGGEALEALAAKNCGAMLIVSHHGNAELTRATCAKRFSRDVYALLHTRHARLYNGMIRALRPEAGAHAIEVDSIDPGTAALLRERVERGDCLAIAGDRTPVSGPEHTVRVPFLGSDAPFATGPYVLAAVMGCPVLLLFCKRQRGEYTITIEHFADRIVLPRGRRNEALKEYTQAYAKRLEAECLEAPEQFYNFYDFWAASASDQRMP